jgi:hypothetical protein
MTQNPRRPTLVPGVERGKREPLAEWHSAPNKPAWGTASLHESVFGTVMRLRRYEGLQEEQDSPVEFRFHESSVQIQQYVPINVAGELEQMHKDLLDVRETVRDMKVQLADVQSKLKELDEIKSLLAPLVNIVRSVTDENFALQSLAESSFAFWDNDEDAAYDQL